jgi:hypothetical protein
VLKKMKFSEIGRPGGLDRPNIEQRNKARQAVLHHLRDGDWHQRREMGEKLKDDVPRDWLFGFVKNEQQIEHMQRGRFYWRLPTRVSR